jgi:hypothetical protein
MRHIQTLKITRTVETRIRVLSAPQNQAGTPIPSPSPEAGKGRWTKWTARLRRWWPKLIPGEDG